MTLEKLRSRLTDDHPTTLTAMHGLAKAYQHSGQSGRAISLFETTLAKQRIKLGDDHPDTLLSLYELAKAHASARQSEKARLEDSRVHRTSTKNRLPPAPGLASSDP